VTPTARLISAPVGDGSAALMAVVRELDLLGIPTEDIALRRPTLDEVFLKLTGSGATTPARDDSEAA
jgi:ABC-2 type transport system ATP-binding protein